MRLPWAALRRAIRRYGPAVAVGVVVEQFQLGHQAARLLEAAVAADRIVTNMPRPFPVVKRPRTEYAGDPSAYQQISYANNRSKYRKLSLGKLVTSNIVRQDFWFSGVKSFVSYGNYWCSKTDDTATGSNYLYPVYLFAPFHVWNGGTVTTKPTPLRRLCMNSATGNFRSITVNGYDANGGASAALQLAENDSLGNTNMGPQCCLKWTEFKFNLWGAKNKTTRWEIMFVRPKTSDSNPFKIAVGSAFNDEAQEEFQEFVRSRVTNPISSANNLNKSNWKIIKRFVYDIAPIDNQEGDQDPHVKRVKIFNSWNRMLRYDWTTSVAAVMTAADMVNEFADPTKNKLTEVLDTVNVRPEDTKDVFVIISATNYNAFEAVASSDVNTKAPSFDLSFRSSFSRLGTR